MGYRIGLDIGGSKIRGVLVDEKKTIIASCIFQTSKTKKEFQRTLKIMLRRFAAHQGRLVRVGIGVAGVIKKTKVVWSPNILYLKNFDFHQIFAPPLRLIVDNDARAFLKGELLYDRNIQSKKILLFTVGTGVGRAYAAKGEVQKIKKFEYPEVWEKEYQKIRDTKNELDLARFLTDKLFPLVKKFKPEVIIFGGGVMKRKIFLGRVKKEFLRQGVKTIIKRSVGKEFTAAFGAAF